MVKGRGGVVLSWIEGKEKGPVILSSNVMKDYEYVFGQWWNIVQIRQLPIQEAMKHLNFIK